MATRAVACASVMLSLSLALGTAGALASGSHPRGHRHAPRYVLAVPLGVIQPQFESYRRYVRNLLARLDSQVQTLLSAEQSGDLTLAREDWLPAHVSWLEVGEDDKAYGAFGPLGDQIDGTSAGLVGGVSNAKFSGFHRVEYELWERADLAAAESATVALQRSLARLQSLGVDHYLPARPRAIGSWVLRCHEILEDADRDTLTAQDDYGSGTGAATVLADVAATRELLDVLAPDIRTHAHGLLRTVRGLLGRVVGAANASRTADGSWVAIAALTSARREALDAAVGAALERLAPISDLLHVAGDAS